jgi:AcrR family transcriptional regulator
MPKISARTLALHRAEMFDRLLDSFADLLMAKGYEAVSLADVAALAGLARTAIYNYFPDRSSLLIAWTEREVSRTLEGLTKSLEDAETPSAKLELFIRSQLESFATSHLPPGLEVGQLIGPETHERFMKHVAPLEELCLQIIKEGLEAGEFNDVAPEATVPMVLACIGAERGPLAMRTRDVDESAQRVTTFLLRALGARSQSS